MGTSMQTNAMPGIGERRSENCCHVVLFDGLLDECQHLESTATIYFDTFVIILILYVRAFWGLG
jgi:hypothetical protein